MESLRLEKTSKISKSNRQPITPMPTNHHHAFSNRPPHGSPSPARKEPGTAAGAEPSPPRGAQSEVREPRGRHAASTSLTLQPSLVAATSTFSFGVVASRKVSARDLTTLKTKKSLSLFSPLHRQHPPLRCIHTLNGFFPQSVLFLTIVKRKAGFLRLSAQVFTWTRQIQLSLCILDSAARVSSSAQIFIPDSPLHSTFLHLLLVHARVVISMQNHLTTSHQYFLKQNY